MELPRLEPKLRSLSERMPGETRRVAGRFVERFPGFSWKGPLGLSLSFGQFEAVWRAVEGRRTLVLGLDAVAYYRGPYANVAPLLDHALAHQLLPAWNGPGRSAALVEPLGTGIPAAGGTHAESRRHGRRPRAPRAIGHQRDRRAARPGPEDPRRARFDQGDRPARPGWRTGGGGWPRWPTPRAPGRPAGRRGTLARGDGAAHRGTAPPSHRGRPEGSRVAGKCFAGLRDRIRRQPGDRPARGAGGLCRGPRWPGWCRCRWRR